MKSHRIEVKVLLDQLGVAAESAGCEGHTYAEVGDYPLPAFLRSASEDSPDRRSIYLSAGIHGDEPAGPLALLELLQENALPSHHSYTICPLMNPTGLEAGTRENFAGRDLNRNYSSFSEAETAGHRDWLGQHLSSIDLGLHLHEDWETEGFYFYELNWTAQPSHAESILAAVNPIIPIETATTIDGRAARGGVIRPERIPETPEGLPESLHLQERFGGLNYTLETPSRLPLARRIAALKAAVLATL